MLTVYMRQQYLSLPNTDQRVDQYKQTIVTDTTQSGFFCIQRRGPPKLMSKGTSRARSYPPKKHTPRALAPHSGIDKIPRYFPQNIYLGSERQACPPVNTNNNKSPGPPSGKKGGRNQNVGRET